MIIGHHVVFRDHKGKDTHSADNNVEAEPQHAQTVTLDGEL
jgi:hypothetical protein